MDTVTDAVTGYSCGSFATRTRAGRGVRCRRRRSHPDESRHVEVRQRHRVLHGDRGSVRSNRPDIAASSRSTLRSSTRTMPSRSTSSPRCRSVGVRTTREPCSASTRCASSALRGANTHSTWLRHVVSHRKVLPHVGNHRAGAWVGLRRYAPCRVLGHVEPIPRPNRDGVDDVRQVVACACTDLDDPRIVAGPGAAPPRRGDRHPSAGRSCRRRGSPHVRRSFRHCRRRTSRRPRSSDSTI